MSGKIEAKTPEFRLRHLGLTLPPVPQAAGNYAGFISHGSLLVISGQLSRRADGSMIIGRVGAELTLAQGQEAAQVSALNILAQIKAAIGGDWDRVATVLRLNGFVQSAQNFTDQAQVINGASDLMASVLGAKGVHSRIAVGAFSLPLNSATEIDALVALA